MYYNLLTLATLAAAVFGVLWWRERLTIRRLRLQNHEHAMQEVELYGRARKAECRVRVLQQTLRARIRDVPRLDAKCLGRAATAKRLAEREADLKRAVRRLTREVTLYQSMTGRIARISQAIAESNVKAGK